MKKAVGTIVILIIIFAGVTVANSTKPPASEDTDQIRETIQQYFDSLSYSIKDKDAVQLEKLNDWIDTASTDGFKVYEYETGKAKFLIEGQRVEGTEVKNFTNDLEIHSIDVAITF